MKKYLSLFRMRFITGLQYRAAAIAGISTQFAWGFLNILLFKALYETNPSAFPLEFSELSAYIWLRQAFLALFNSWQFDPEIMQMITNGNIAYELARPVDIYTLWFVRGLSTRLSKTALRCLPILVIAFLLPQPYGLTLPPSFINALIFVFSMALAAFCVCSYTMIVYIMCCHTVNSMGVKIIMQNLVDFLSGGLVPLMFMPSGLRKVLEYSPFGAMENLPFRIYSGNIAGEEMWRFFTLQLFWCVVLIAVGKLWMKSSLKKVVIQGG